MDTSTSVVTLFRIWCNIEPRAWSLAALQIELTCASNDSVLSINHDTETTNTFRRLNLHVAEINHVERAYRRYKCNFPNVFNFWSSKMFSCCPLSELWGAFLVAAQTRFALSMKNLTLTPSDGGIVVAPSLLRMNHIDLHTPQPFRYSFSVFQSET